MNTNRKPTATPVLALLVPLVLTALTTLATLATLALILGPTPAYAGDRALARMLQDTVHDFDRESLDAGVFFRGDNGDLRHGVRCATRPVADFEQQFIESAVSEHLQTAGNQHRSRSVEIPVHFTILRRKNGEGDVTNAQIDEQMSVLNGAFGEHGFSFVLDGVSRRNRNKFARKCLKESVEAKFKKKYAVDPSTTLNIYTCRPTDDVLGYAYFPSDYPEDSSMHGVVLLHSSLPGGSAVPYDLGDTAVHEVGHYLGLFHTFQGKCGKTGDRISDTPREKTPAAGCPVNRDTCSQPGLDPVRNFMDYSDDDCVDEFTPQQELWMQDQLETFRPSLGG